MTVVMMILANYMKSLLKYISLTHITSLPRLTQASH